MTTATATTKRDALLADLADLWRGLDQLFEGVGPKAWSRKHGKDWTIADVPYHLAYFDREMIVRGLDRGTDLPEEEQMVWRSSKDVNAWNAVEFAKRPPSQTPEQSLAQMRASRAAIRERVTRLSDADLERSVWCPLPGTGWISAETGVKALRAHTWGHFMQLRYYLKRSTPVLSASATYGALGFYLSFMPFMLDRKRAAGVDFTAVMEMTGPGGGAWSYHVKDGACTFSEGRAGHPDLVMTQSPETFIKTFAHIHNPMVAILKRQIRVRGLRKLPTFGKLFPPESEDTVFDPQAAAALG
jgi:hypothetical protein